MPPRRPGRRNSMVAKALLGLLPLAPPVIQPIVHRAFQPAAHAKKASLAAPESEVTMDITRDQATAAQCDDVLDFQDCHSRFPTGCSQAAGYDADLNYLKNLLIPAPAAGTDVKFLSQQDFQNLDANLPSGLSRGNHGDFKSELENLGETKLFGVTGFLYYAQPSGVESSNCQLSDTDPPEGSNVDYHIGIGFDIDLAHQAAAFPDPKHMPKALLKKVQQNSVIVEMTPHSRFNFEPNVWTIENVRAVVGKPVRVVGQLLVDNEHISSSQNCATASTTKERGSCWRMSVWELHPVVSFQTCSAASCSLNDTRWVELSQASGGG